MVVRFNLDSLKNITSITEVHLNSYLAGIDSQDNHRESKTTSHFIRK